MSAVDVALTDISELGISLPLAEDLNAGVRLLVVMPAVLLNASLKVIFAVIVSPALDNLDVSPDKAELAVELAVFAVLKAELALLAAVSAVFCAAVMLGVSAEFSQPGSALM